MTRNEAAALGSGIVIAAAWGGATARYIHALLPDKLVNAHSGMTALQYQAVAPSVYDPLIKALITMGVGLVPILGTLLTAVVGYMVWRVHKMMGDGQLANTTLAQNQADLMKQVKDAATAAALAAIRAERAGVLAQAGAAQLSHQIESIPGAAPTPTDPPIGTAPAIVDPKGKP